MPGHHFRLLTLGRLSLLGTAGEEDASLARRRFKLALLTVLAMARRPLPRDRLLELFWGEHPEERARHSLSNALSSLRRALGPRAITTRDADVALAPDVDLRVDALELAEAVEGRDFARAVDLYTGPFLDGVRLDEEGAAFEQWVSRERRRLGALFVQACAQHCAMLARARRWPECHALAVRWLDAEPLSADAAIYLLNAAKAPGTRAALAQALEEYDALRVRLARDFELPPEPPVRDLAERIREQMATLAEPVSSPAVPGPLMSEPRVGVTPAGQPAPLVTVAPAPASAELPRDAGASRGEVPGAPPARVLARARPHSHVPWRIIGPAAAVGALAFALLARASQRANEEVPAGGSRRPVIAVLSMNVRTADTTFDWLTEGLPQMIAGKLGHIAAVDVAPQSQVRAVLARSGHAANEPLADTTARDLARRIGATLVAHGAIGRDGDSLVLDLTVHDVGSGELLASAVLTRGSALALADEAAARILGAANVNAPGPQFAELETSSLEAYEHYMRALEAGQAGRMSEYLGELDAAIALDSGFFAVVKARIMLAISANDTALVGRLRDTMRRHASRATEFDRLEQELTDAYYAGERERSEALGRGLVRRYPRDPRSYQLLQTVLSSHGEVDEAERVAVQGLALDSLAMEAGSGPCAPCLGFFSIVTLHWRRGDWAGAAEWARRWIRRQPDAPAAWGTLAWTMSYMQRPDSALPLMQRAVVLSGGDLWANNELAHMLLVARRYAAADSVITMMESSPSAEWREKAFDLRSLLEREHGRYRASDLTIERYMNAYPGSRGFGEMIRADNLRNLGHYATAAERYERLVHAPGEGPLPLPWPPTGARALCWHHALAADAYAPTGDTVTLRAKADTLEAGCSSSYYGRDWRLHHHVRGLVAMHARRYAEAEQEFRQAVWTPMEGWSRTVVELAAAQAALGRPRDAIATLRTAYATRLDAMGRYVPISELDWRMARAFAQAGERDSAGVYAAYVRTAWGDADPEIRRLLADLP